MAEINSPMAADEWLMTPNGGKVRMAAVRKHMEEVFTSPTPEGWARTPNGGKVREEALKAAQENLRLSSIENAENMPPKNISAGHIVLKKRPIVMPTTNPAPSLKPDAFTIKTKTNPLLKFVDELWIGLVTCSPPKH